MTWLIATIGWVGAVSLLAAYLLLIGRRTTVDSHLYLTLNFAGSACLAISTSVAHAWPSAAANLTWLVIGSAPLIRARFKVHGQRQRPCTGTNADPCQPGRPRLARSGKAC